MKRQRGKRVISMALVIVMMLGMFPTVTHAAEEPKVESYMKLERAFSYEMLSVLCHQGSIDQFQNYYQAPVTRGSLNDNRLEWMLLSYVFQFSQNIDLELWRLPESYQNDGQNPLPLAPNYEDGNALEPFLANGT